ncbi:hypothetical protein TSMEX_001536 [Taenia solium]|eukprot:TsM_001228200 transcript=TsM_001228200 gene=TsM_001228200
MAIHASIRENSTVLSKKLTPLKYCKDLERLTEQWVNICTQSRPSNPRFVSLGSNVMAAPVFESVEHKWRGLMPRERRNYNRATGECTAAPCEHLRQVVQSNNTYFGCAVRDYVLWMPINLSVCLYEAEGHGVPTQQEVAPSNATTTTASTTMVRSATVMVKSGNRPEPPSLASTISFVAECTVNYFTDHFVEGEEGEEGNYEEKEVEEDEEEEEEDEEIEEKVFDLITPLESTIAKVKSTGSLASPLLDIDKMEEADEEEEEDDDSETEKASKSTQLSPLFPSFAFGGSAGAYTAKWLRYTCGPDARHQPLVEVGRVSRPGLT